MSNPDAVELPRVILYGMGNGLSLAQEAAQRANLELYSSHVWLDIRSYSVVEDAVAAVYEDPKPIGVVVDLNTLYVNTERDSITGFLRSTGIRCNGEPLITATDTLNIPRAVRYRCPANLSLAAEIHRLRRRDSYDILWGSHSLDEVWTDRVHELSTWLVRLVIAS